MFLFVVLSFNIKLFLTHFDLFKYDLAEIFHAFSVPLDKNLVIFIILPVLLFAFLNYRSS